jgi:RNA-directed DNA polymerase
MPVCNRQNQMKRILITLDAVADHKNLALAFHKAAKGKRFRQDVQVFLQNFSDNLNQLGEDIRQGKLPYGDYRVFEIYDPKHRLIHAACFADRIFHHALMNVAGAILEQSMMPSSYACRPNKGVHKAACKVQQHLRQYDYYGKIDISGYFASISHSILLQLLMHRFKGEECHAQFERIIHSYHASPAHGLPIGSLTSQYFANYYLDGSDRLLSGLPTVRAQVRYMDDIIWWCDNKHETQVTLHTITDWLLTERDLHIKPSVQIQPSWQGVTYCGFRILPGMIRLSRRRKRRYQERRQYWEMLYQRGLISSNQLQTAYAAVHAISAGTDSLAWRRENLLRHPPLVV